jgi:formate--tetrahydrofolate ligase
VTNLDIAQAATLRPIQDVALEAGLSEEFFEPLGRYKAKLTYSGMAALAAGSKRGKLVLVSAITPTPAGEGKTTTTVGLAQGLCRLGHRAVPAIREPALGPVFGVKGGACGGGYSQVLPMEDINLFFTGDFPAISAAHNLLSALLDAHIYHGNASGIDLRTVRWPRTIDMNDRALREITVGLGGKSNGYPRTDGFVITPASEIMAVLCLSRSLEDLKERLGRLVVGETRSGVAVTGTDIGATGAMAALLRDAIRPNLVQTLEGGLAFVHGGPFGNIAHGCSSVAGKRAALGTADFVVTEGGFGSDLGGEKFLNIKTRALETGPDAIVLVATIRALAHHGSGDLKAGLSNLWAHHAHLSRYGRPVVVAINRRAEDTADDLELLKKACQERQIACVEADPWGSGGPGCEALAAVVAEACQAPGEFRHLYELGTSAQQKMDTIAQLAYGGDGVDLSATAKKSLDWICSQGAGEWPVCMAKTQYSLSDNAALLGAPSGFRVQVRDVKLSAGAGFMVAVAGDILLMPGLGKTPAAQRIDVDAEGRIIGLF